METTLGKRISFLRRQKGLKQEELADMLNVSFQAVSKWENDINCPDISLLPKLAELLGVSIDELILGEDKKEKLASVKVLPPEKRKNMDDMLLRIMVDSSDGDKVRVNVPVELLKVASEMGMELPQISGNDTLKNIDFKKIIELIFNGVVGTLVEVESADGDSVRIVVE